MGGPNRTGDADTSGGPPGTRPAATRGQRWPARLAFAAAAAAVLVLVLAGALRSVTALVVGFAGLAIACAAAWWFLVHRGMLRWLALAVLVAAPVVVIVVYVVAGLLWEVALSVVLAAVALAAGARGTPRRPLAGHTARTCSDPTAAPVCDHESTVGRREGREVRA
jgi:hypothetical protein